jgi:hypothetical protein
MVSSLRTSRRPNNAPVDDAVATAVRRRALAFILPALLLSIIAMMMLEQSVRWAATAAVRHHFIETEFQIDQWRDDPGKGGLALHGHVVSSGEAFYTGSPNEVSLGRLRALAASGKVTGAREPVHYLPPDAPGAFLDPAIRFRVQAPDMFEVDARGWVVVNVLVGAAAFWLMRRGVRVAKNKGKLK